MEREEQSTVVTNDNSAEMKRLLEEYLLDSLKNGERTAKKPDGTFEYQWPISATLLGVIRQYVKDFPPNFVPQPGEATGVLKKYAQALPFADAAPKSKS